MSRILRLSLILALVPATPGPSSAVRPDAITSACSPRFAVPSTDPDSVFVADSLDFGLHFPGGFPDLEAVAHNAGYGRWWPGLNLVLLTGGSISLNGNICLSGDAHANGTIFDPDHFLCGPDLIDTYSFGFPVDLPAASTEPDSFPGATYYHVSVADGPGPVPDTLLILDRDRIRLSQYVAPATPDPRLTWSYQAAAKKLVLLVTPTTLFDQVTGLFPRTGADSTVVVNFGGQAGGDHLMTDMSLRETGSFQIETTLINARFTGSSCPERTIPSFWVGGNTTIIMKSIFAPRSGLAVIASTFNGNAQTTLGTSTRPAATLVTNNAAFAAGQWFITGSLFCLGDADLGGGVDLTFDPRPEPILPPGFRPGPQSRLEITGAVFTGPDGPRFSIVGGFVPAVIGAEPAPYVIHFDDAGTTVGGQYEGALVLSTRDLDSGTALPDLVWTLVADRRGQVGVDPAPPVLERLRLSAGHPNPFRRSCTIEFELPRPARVTLEILDTRGGLVSTLLDEEGSAGHRQVTWNGCASSGRRVPPGRYFCRLGVEGRSLSRPVVLLP